MIGYSAILHYSTSDFSAKVVNTEVIKTPTNFNMIDQANKGIIKWFLAIPAHIQGELYLF